MASCAGFNAAVQTCLCLDQTADRQISAEIPRLDLERIDVEIADINIPHLDRWRRPIAGVAARRAVMKLVTAPMRQRKCLALAESGKFARKIMQP